MFNFMSSGRALCPTKTVFEKGGGISAPPSGLDDGDMSSDACSLMRLRLQKKTQQDIILSRQLCVTVALSAQPRFYLRYHLLRFITPDSKLCSPPFRQGVDRHKHDRDRDEGRCRQSQGSRLTAARSPAQDCQCGQGRECKFYVCVHAAHAPNPVQPQATHTRLTSGLLPLPRCPTSCDAGPQGRGSGPM